MPQERYASNTPLTCRPLVLCVAALMTGILTAATTKIPNPTVYIATACIWCGWCYARKQPGLWLGLLALNVASGIALYNAQHQRDIARWKRGKKLRQAAAKRRPLWLEGIVQERTRWQPDALVVQVQLQRWSFDGLRWTPSDTRVSLTLRQPTTQRAQALLYGDCVRVRVRLSQPSWYANPGLYDPRPTLLRRGIQLVGYGRRHQALLLSRGHRSWRRMLAQYRRALSRWIVARPYDKPVKGILRALLLGDRSGLTNSMRQRFALTGTSHLLAISGLHLAIVAHLFFGLFCLLLGRWQRLLWQGTHKRLAACLSAPWVLAYTILSGASPSTQRACLMLFLLWFALLVRRRAEATNTLALVALMILSWSPKALLTASFQLSFVAVAALVWSTKATRQPRQSIGQTTPPYRKQLYRMASFIWQSLRASCWATCATLPFSLHFSPALPVWGPLINVIAIPLGGYCVVGMGLAAVLLHGLDPRLAGLLLDASARAASILFRWIKVTASWPTPTGCPPLRTWEWLAYGTCLLACLLRHHRRLCACCILVSAISAGLSLVPAGPRSSGQLLVHFLDVGQGDATLLQFPNGQHMMIDAGGRPYGVSSLGQRVHRPHLRWMRIRHLDFAVLSHPHPDHFRGFVDLIGPVSIGEFWTNGQPGRHPAYRQLQQTLKQQVIKERRFHNPTRLWIGQVELRILHPFPNRHEGSTYYWSLHANDNSLVIWLKYKQIRLLLTGDIEKRGEELLLKRWPALRADVLKVPHHGSRTSSTIPLLRQIAPQHAVFCVGRHNRYGFPHPDVLSRYQRRGIRIWRTDHHGRITLRTDGHTMTWATHIGQN